MTTDAEGFRWPHAPLLSDVHLTGDEFIHVGAMWGETLRELMPGPDAHESNPRGAPLGHPHPECPICCSLMEKAERAAAEAEQRRRGQPFQGPS